MTEIDSCDDECIDCWKNSVKFELLAGKLEEKMQHIISILQIESDGYAALGDFDSYRIMVILNEAIDKMNSILEKYTDDGK